MIRREFHLAGLAGLFLLATSHAQAGLPEAIVKLKPSVVLIGTFKATDSPRFQLRGTGFIVGNGQLVVTNSHVLPAPAGGDAPALVVQVRQASGDWQMRPVVTLETNPAVDLVAFEKDKIKGAVRTDFILSAEIIAITLGTVADAPLTQQIIVLSGIAIVMTIGVYGLVGGIVKLDDLGLWLNNKASSVARAVGAGILRAAPWLMKGLSIAGTAAMFLVGGGILVHGVPVLHHAVEGVAAAAGQWPTGGLWKVVVENLLNAVVGIVAGGLVLAGVTLVQRLRGKSTA